MSLPGALLPDLAGYFPDANGAPLAGGKIICYESGTDFGTPKLLYADAGLTTPLPQTVVLNAGGAVTAFLAPGGYDFQVTDANDVLLYTVEGVEDIGLTWFSSLGQQLSTGSKSVTSGYTVLTTDNLVTVNSTAGASTINLPSAADYTAGPLTIMNTAGNTVAITPDGSDTLNGANTAITLAASTGQAWTYAELKSDGVSAWYVTGRWS
jgi:hypothetical protein